MSGSKLGEFSQLSTMSPVVAGHEMTLRNPSEASTAIPLILVWACGAVLGMVCHFKCENTCGNDEYVTRTRISCIGSLPMSN